MSVVINQLKPHIFVLFVIFRSESIKRDEYPLVEAGVNCDFSHEHDDYRICFTK